MRKSTVALIAVCVLVTPVLFVLNGMRNAGIVATALARIDDPYLIDLDGKYVDLVEWKPGHVVVVIFTRTDCPISNRYAPEVRRLYERFHPRGVDFWMVYVDPRETPETIRKHLSEFGYPCPGYRDESHTLVTWTRARVTPEAVVFDSDGKIVYRGRIDDRFVDFGESRDEATSNDLADAIEFTLAGRPVAEPVTKAVGCYIKDLQ